MKEIEQEEAAEENRKQILKFILKKILKSSILFNWLFLQYTNTLRL